ncbi:unnamed protein product [Lymnaea stagnalis]|uniref:Major facilitator superfamily (MFS) profile domain-containing protein n=1 Tax=Lymnaea stagnalis TaxID=6523 RepID=A0AAV2I0B3_LYMST
MYKSHASMLLYLGSFVGSTVLGFVSDRFGRKVCFLLSVILFLASGLALPWSNNFVTLGVLEFVVGAASTGMFASAFVMCLELVQPKDRKVPGLVIQVFFTTGEILLAVSFYGLRDWRWAGLVITAPATFFLFYVWLVPESLRWLMLKKKYDKASKILIRIAKINGVTPPRGNDQEDILAELLQSHDDSVERTASVSHKNKDSFFDLFKSRVLCQRACAIFFNWFVVNMVFYVFVLNMEHLKAGSLYVNFIIGAVVEYPAHLFSLLLVDRVGRKPVHLFLLFVAGTASGAAVGVSMKVGEDHQWVVSMLSMIGKFGAAGLMGTSFLWLTELFPTSIRSSGLGVSSSFARGGAMLAPYIVLWGSMITEHNMGGALPFIVVCAASVLAFLFNLSLPETNQEELPATIADAKVFGKKSESLYIADSRHTGLNYESIGVSDEDSEVLVFPPKGVLKGRTRQGSRSSGGVSLSADHPPIF